MDGGVVAGEAALKSTVASPAGARGVHVVRLVVFSLCKSAGAEF